MSTTNLVVTASFNDFHIKESETNGYQSDDIPEQDDETVVSYGKS
jgi:hypothetical protein